MSNLPNLKPLCLVGLAITLSFATTACRTNNAQQQPPRKKLALELMSDRECIPPAYRTAQDARRATKLANMPPAPSFSQPPVPQPEQTDAFAPVADGAPVFVPADSQPVQTVLPPDAGLPPQAGPTPGMLPPPHTEAAPMPAPQPPAAKRTYTVEKNDSLSIIAYRYGINWRELASENNITDSNRLKVGQVLTLPDNAQENPRPRPVIRKQAAAAPSQAGGTTAGVYVVQQGDTFSKIAKRLKVSEADLKAWNSSIKDTNRIFVGQKLNYGGEATAAKQPAQASQPKSSPKSSAKLPKAAIQPALRVSPDAASADPAPATPPAPAIQPTPVETQEGVEQPEKAPAHPLSPAPAAAPATTAPTPAIQPAPAGPAIPDVPPQSTPLGGLQPPQQPVQPPQLPMPNANY